MEVQAWLVIFKGTGARSGKVAYTEDEDTGVSKKISEILN